MTPTTNQTQSGSARTELQHGLRSRLAFGGAPIGNLYESVDEETATLTLSRAWLRDIRHFDTAPYYGYGLSESRIGAALSGVPRDSFSLSTKVGRLIEADAGQTQHADGFIVDGQRARFDYSRDGVLRSVEASLRRLRTDHVEVLLLHDIGALTHGEHHAAVLHQALNEALPAMEELRTQGVCRAIGLGVNEEAVCLEVMPRFSLDVIMLAGRYTLFEQAHSIGVMAQAKARGIAILAAGPYNSGLLGNNEGPGHFYNYAPADQTVQQRAQRFYDVLGETHTDVGAAALQFPLAHAAVASVVCGLRSVDEVDMASKRMQTPIPNEAWRALRHAGLLQQDAPTP
ncbi:aldo/keto reductase [Dyella caseinilytica]|uniref:Aldo/keto reductase n=1 Tax=Dyella caseinilytica TaxID=1849581 RepID=A0ABX7GZC7_9GAMM|nr:aldo/keto reductase [Dyella caseinilytica]QRN55680.1 aldo/keto reductase [Dyella caseinilytica]GGA03659.1 oxidoreductase [Dyella caseinilytica]